MLDLIVKAVNSPSVKLVFDTFQVQMKSGNIIETIARVWDEIVCFQITDLPRRTEPTNGEMNYQSILKHICSKGYTGLSVSAALKRAIAASFVDSFRLVMLIAVGLAIASAVVALLMLENRKKTH